MELQKARDFDYTKIAPFVALAVLIAVSATMSEHFLKPQNLLNVLRQVSFTGVIALGMTFVIIGGGIDLSVGSAVAFAGAIGLMAMNSVGDGVVAVLAGIGAAVGVGSACGAFNGILVAKGRVAPFIATLGTMSIFRSLTLHICQAGEVRANNALFQKLGAGTFLWVPVPAWAFLILAVLFHILLTKTRFGRYVYAVGANETVARYSAIKVGWIKMGTYALTGLAVAISAILLSSRLNSISSTGSGQFYELDAIAAVVIGGTVMSGGEGTIYGTVVGAIVLGIISNMLNLIGVSTYLQGTVRGLVIIGAVLLQYKKGD